jgi:hypothetical protein
MFILSSTKIRDKGKRVPAGSEGVGEGGGSGEKGRERGQGGEMTQTLHAHMNK